MFGLNKKELKIIKRLSTPIKIQKFLDSIPINFEQEGETYMSPRKMLEQNKAHCFEGALFSALCLWYHGQKPLILDLKSFNGDDHLVTLYKINGYWGAISKTNHATLRFRDPVYKTIRELAVSYYHEYFDTKSGKKILESYSKPFDLSKLGDYWITCEKHMFKLAEQIDKSPHIKYISKAQYKFVRKADSTELKAGNILEWPKN